MPIRDQEAFLWGGDAEVLFLANRGANGIDGLLSSGIGAAAASGRPTVIVTGDLGLLHDLGGLAALAHVSTPVRIVVVDNGGGGIFGFLPQAAQLAADEFEALLATPRPLALATVAELFGIGHHRVERLDRFARRSPRAPVSSRCRSTARRTSTCTAASAPARRSGRSPMR